MPKRKTDIIIGKIIKRERKRRYYTQEGLAKELGVSVATLCNWENGKNSMGAKRYIEISSVLRMDLDKIHKEIENLKASEEN